MVTHILLFGYINLYWYKNDYLRLIYTIIFIYYHKLTKFNKI
jgi:hypothetical protein